MKKNNKKWNCVMVLLIAFLCSGCGEKHLEVTEEEEKVIVNYAAHTVAKYNNLQNEGLTYVTEKSVDDVKESEDDVKDSEDDKKKSQKASDSAQTITNSDETETIEKKRISFQEALGLGQVAATYKGYEIATSYAEGGYYEVDAKQGETFLIMHVDLTNRASEAMNCNLLDAGPVFTLNINNGTKVQAETTILLNDLSTFSADLEVGQTTSTVLLFQIPQETANSIQNVDLQVLIHDTTYDINLGEV